MSISRHAVNTQANYDDTSKQWDAGEFFGEIWQKCCNGRVTGVGERERTVYTLTCRHEQLTPWITLDYRSHTVKNHTWDFLGDVPEEDNEHVILLITPPLPSGATSCSSWTSASP